MTELRISDELSLPLEAVTETIAILAKRGAGKSYTASVLVEEMLEHRLQVVVLDPMGHWQGLRSSADGADVGFAIAVLGGDRGDVPLESTAGTVVADLVVDERLSAVLDLSRFSKGERRRFVTDFLERLYHRNREAMHVVLEEADLFAPQRAPAGEERMLGAVYDLVRRGRGRGLGSTLITQRSASLSKEVLEQSEVLVALRTTGPRDRKAIEAWIDVHGEDEERREVMASLPSLPTGQAWVWWPVEGILQRVTIRRRRTFDSSATPRPGESRRAPKTVADVDLDALEKRMADTIEKAKADDPKELRNRIRELERDLGVSRSQSEQLPPPERIEVPVLNGQVGELREVVAQLATVGERLVGVGSSITGAIERVASHDPGIIRPHSGRNDPAAPRPRAPAPERPRPAPAATDADPSLGRAERTFLGVLVQHPRGLSKTQLAVLTGYSLKSSSIGNGLGRLRTLGYATKGEPVMATAEGVAAAGDLDPLPEPGRDLVEYWLAKLGKAERAFLEALVDAWPDELTKEELADRTGYSLTSSSVGNALGRLRTLGLVDGLRASDDLMGGG